MFSFSLKQQYFLRSIMHLHPEVLLVVDHNSNVDKKWSSQSHFSSLESLDDFKHKSYYNTLRQLQLKCQHDLSFSQCRYNDSFIICYPFIRKGLITKYAFVIPERIFKPLFTDNEESSTDHNTEHRSIYCQIKPDGTLVHTSARIDRINPETTAEKAHTLASFLPSSILHTVHPMIDTCLKENKQITDRIYINEPNQRPKSKRRMNITVLPVLSGDELNALIYLYEAEKDSVSASQQCELLNQIHIDITCKNKDNHIIFSNADHPRSPRTHLRSKFDKNWPHSQENSTESNIPNTLVQWVEKDEEGRTYISAVAPIMNSGKVLGSYETSIDIHPLAEQLKEKSTEIKKLKRELIQVMNNRQASTRLQEIIDNIPGHIYWEDKNGIFLGSNKQLTDWIGLKSPKDILGKSILDISELLDISHEDSINIRKTDLEIMESGQPRLIEEAVTIEDKDIYFLSYKTPLMENGEVVGLIGVSLDITERKNLEKKLKQAHQSKSEFIANISHDFRTPLHTLRGTAELLHAEEQYPKQKERISVLLQCSDLLQSLIENALSYSQLSDGQLVVKHEEFDLRELTQSLASTFRPILESKNLQLSLDISQIHHTSVISDSYVLMRILINLVQNAVKFTSLGSVSITLTEESISPTQSLYVFSVKDTGVGIAAEELHSIFKRYYQNKESKGVGMGLGLDISKRLTNLLDGNISAESTPGVGSVFTVKIPMYIIKKPKNSSIYDINQSLKLDSPNILLIEDNKMVQTMTVHLLKELNCQCQIASNGAEGIAYSKKSWADLILLDLGLPDISGLEVLEEIRSENQEIPILALTAEALPHVREHCFKKGASDFLPKPASKHDLHKVILKLLNKST